jgi:hypothetical protein
MSQVVEAAPRDVICAYSDFYIFGEGIPRQTVVRPEYHAADDYRVQMLLDWSIPPLTAMFRADLGRQVRFPEYLTDYEDSLFFAVLRERGRFIRVPEALAGYRRHPAQQTAMRGHSLRTVRAKCEWFRRRLDHYSASEIDAIQRPLRAQLEELHDEALWARNHAVVRETRKLYKSLGSTVEVPPLFGRYLPPEWIMRLWDRVNAQRERRR